jgi:hypothetical protein
MSKALHMTLECGSRVELIPVFVPGFADAGAVPKFAGYRLNLIRAPGAGIVSPVELEEIAHMLAGAARGARRATR